MGLSNKLSYEAGNFSCCCLHPHRCFQLEVLRLYFPTGALGCGSASLPSCSSWFIRMKMWYHPLLQMPPFCIFSVPGCPSPPLPPVWVNVSSLSPWLSDFHTVWFSASSGCFLFLNYCCPSFGCAKRHSVSTYASILAGSSLLIFIY